MSFANRLDPITETKSDNHDYFVFDIETNGWNEFVCIGHYGGPKYPFSYFDSIEAYFNHIGQLDPILDTSRNVPRLDLFAHNGGRFDYRFILDYCLKNLHRYQIFDMPMRGSGILSIDIDDKLYGKNYRLRDSVALMPFRLSTLTKDFSVETVKGEYDHKKKKTLKDKALIKYLESDCKGLWQVLERFYQFGPIQEAGRAGTIASQSVQCFRRTLSRPLYRRGDLIEDQVRQSYMGGRTEVYKPVFNDPGSLKVYDINSLYPSVMRDFDYPTDFKGFSKKISDSKMGFYDVLVHVPDDLYIPPLGVNYKIGKTMKFIFPTGYVRGHFSSAELQYAEGLGCKIMKVHSGLLYESRGKIFKKYIDDLYNLRLKAQKENNGVANIICKLLMNSLYGRFGMKLERENYYVGDLLPGTKMYSNTSLIHKKQVTLKSFTHVALASWTTSQARIRFHKYLSLCGQDIWYGDTDSLFTTRDLPTSDKLGGLKLEIKKGIINEACFLLPKTYAIRAQKAQEIVMKGFVTDSVKHLSVKDFVSFFEGEISLLKAKQPEKFCTFITAVKANDLLKVLPSQDRKIKSRYDKRVIIQTGKKQWDTIPHKIDMR